MHKKMKHKTGSDITEHPYRPIMTALSLNFLFLKLVQVVKCHVVWLQKKDILINN